MAASLLSLVVVLATAHGDPQKLIIDTDIGGGGCKDVDDVAALSVGHALMDNSEAELLAVVVNTSPDKCPGVVSVMNHLYGRDDIPIGSYKGSDLQKSTPHKYVDDLVNGWDSPIKTASQVPNSVDVYRQVLAAQPDHSVAISSIGLMTNLRALLQSQGDKYSPLSGPELVAQKVKLLAAMAGQYPSGSECNMEGGGGQDHATGSAASYYVYSHWPSSVPIIFSGGEVGSNVHTGGPIYNCMPNTNPIKLAFTDYVGYGNTRPSWDPLTTLIAVRGVKAGGCSLCTNCDGKNSVDKNGGNKWISGQPSNQSYLILDDGDYAAKIMNDLMCQGPKHPPAPAPTPKPSGCKTNATAKAGAGPPMGGYGGGDYKAAWDSDVNTFYDFSQENGGWTQASLDSNVPVSGIRYYPRAGFLQRSVGGRFVGVADSGKETNLATISKSPTLGWNVLNVKSGDKFSSVKYYAPDGGYGNIAEIEVYTPCGDVLI